MGTSGKELQVVDEALLPARQGEILLGGDQRCMGTLDGGLAGSWLRTGDLARVDSQGRVVVLGRRDGLVKVRGRRMHLQELERRLRSVPGIAAAAVVAVPGTGLPEAGPRLVAFCVNRLGRSSAALSKEVEVPGLAGWLDQVRVVRSLPLTSRGKPDLQSSLQALAAPTGGALSEAEALAGALEALGAALGQLLGRHLTPSEWDTDFRSLGGDSLLALGAREHLRRAVGMEPSAEELLEAPSLRGLVEELMRRARERVSTDAPCHPGKETP